MLFWALFSTLIASITGIIVFIYYHCKGQFDDPEDVKYQMFREEE